MMADDHREPDDDPAIDEDLEYEVLVAQQAFATLVPLTEPDASVAALAVEAVVRALGDARAPDDPTPGMMNVATLVTDPLARATLADAAPSAREVLGDLERILVGIPAAERSSIGTRITEAVVTANDRIAAEHDRHRA